MNKLTEEHLIMLNEKVSKQNGEVHKVRDMNLLKKVVDDPYIQDKEFFYIYKTKVDKAAKLGTGIVKNKPFANNNVATATLAIFTFLELNGKKIVATQNEIYKLHDLLINDNESEVIDWLKTHIK